MTASDLPSDVSVQRAREIDDACDAFEDAWKSDSPPDWESFLRNFPSESWHDLARELIPLDVHYRLLTGGSPTPEVYANRVSLEDRPWIQQLVRDALSAGPSESTTAAGIETVWVENSATAMSPARPQSNDLSSVFEIRGELGRGAMGVVYLAKQTSLGRTVALKMVHAGVGAGREELARLRAEGEAVARLHHPNIVQIFDMGEFEGKPYLALEYVDGGTLAQRTAGVPQPPRDAARLVETLATAMHHAHKSGVIHRDLKPANVLMTSEGVPKITDFGLAKRLEIDHSGTVTGMLMGTPQYMAPEQASGEHRALGPSVDIHALGVLLYELITGRAPFQAGTLTKLLDKIRHDEPIPPRLVKQTTPRDLETICLKCLHKDPTRRYRDAASLAEDLRRFLANSPILARRTSVAERMWRWSRRNPWSAGLAASLVLVLVSVAVAGFVTAESFRTISEIQSKSADEARQAMLTAEQRRLETQLELARSRVDEAGMTRRSGRPGQYSKALSQIKLARDEFRSLNEHGFPVPDDDWRQLRDEAASTLLVPDLQEVERWKRNDESLPEVATDLNHRRYLRFARGAKQASVCRFGSDDPVWSLDAPNDASFQMARFAADGNRLAVTAFHADQARMLLHIWDVSDSPKLVRSIPVDADWPLLNSAGSILATKSADGTATQIQSVDDGGLLATIAGCLVPYAFPFHPKRPWIALVKDGVKLQVFDFEQQRIQWESDFNQLAPTFAANGRIENVSWSSDGRWCALANSRSLIVVDGDKGTTLVSSTEHESEGVFPIAANNIGLLAAVDWSGTLRLRDSGSGSQQMRVSMRFFNFPTTNGLEESFTLGYEGNEFVAWRAHRGSLREFARSATSYVAVSPSGKWLAVRREPGGAALYSLPGCELAVQLDSAWGDLPLAFELNDQALWTYGSGSLTRIPMTTVSSDRNAENDDAPDMWIGPAQHVIKSGVRDRWGMDRLARTVAIPNYGGGSLIINRRSNQEQFRQIAATPPQNDVRSCEVSPDGRWLAAGSHVLGQVTVYDALSGLRVRTLADIGGFGKFSPDGRWLAVMRFSGGMDIFRVEDWNKVYANESSSVAFSSEGSLVAVDDGSSAIAFLDTRTWAQLGRLEFPDPAPVSPVSFSAGDTGLVALVRDERRLIHIDLAGLQADLRELGLGWEDWPLTSTPIEQPPAPIKVELFRPFPWMLGD